MTPRERYRRTLLFQEVDKVPFQPGGPRESTLKRWQEEGLPKDRNWFEYLCKILGLEIEKAKTPYVNLKISFDPYPPFEEKIIERRGNHLIVQDYKGAIVEIEDKYDFSYLRYAKDFVTRKWHKFPVEKEEDWEEMKKRFNPDSPERLDEELEEKAKILKDRDWVLTINIPGPFWQMRDWCGLENLCIYMIEKPKFVYAMSEFWRNFVSTLLKKFVEKIQFDSVIISEDMAYKGKSMISPQMAREFLAPCWREWSDILRKSGCAIIILDSDGYIGELIPIWIESGINCTIPFEIAAGNDPVELRKRFGKSISFIGGIDKRKIAKGGNDLKEEMERIIPFMLKDGGYIPSCDHGVPPDISWRNFLEYSYLLAKYTGWL
jgi:uroporphyrinogen decarboxylase